MNEEEKQVPAQTDNVSQEVITDGQHPIPQDSQGVVDGQYQSPTDLGQADIKFAKGNWNEMGGVAQKIMDKEQVLRKQVAPLVCVALIELLGSSTAYEMTYGSMDLTLDNGQPSVAFTMQGVVPLWIGTDIDPKDVKADATYILNKLRLIKDAQISKCSIDTQSGMFDIRGTI